ncbi:hypothetical protein VNO77_37722 [Canavalia gladiata]|uniref:Sucrose phosphatase-like domain-containing protein n=1 Tax=Canavalia gladiata TaxID=3824 RepID=A0AAN9PYL8_CANGL
MLIDLGSRVKIKSLILSSKLNLDLPYVLTWTEPNWHGDSFSDFCSISDCDKSKFTLKVSIKRKKIRGISFTDTEEEAATNLDPIVVLTTRSIRLNFYFVLFPELSWELDIMDRLKSLPRLVFVSDLDHTMVDHHDTENSSLFRFNALWEAHYRHDPLLAFSAGRSPTLNQQLRKEKPMKQGYASDKDPSQDFAENGSVQCKGPWVLQWGRTPLCKFI